MSSVGSDRFLRARSALALVLLLLAPACALSMTVPGDFLALDTAGCEVKATTSDEARLWVRDFCDPDDGSAKFWADTLRHDFVTKRGYTLLERRDVRDGAGRDGIEMRFSTTVDGAARGYLIAVFVIPGTLPWASNSVRVVEFVSDRGGFDKYVDAVHASIATLDG